MTLQVLCLHLLGKTLFPKVSQVCDKCDGKHPTEKCPFFPLERSRHKDAWVRETQYVVCWLSLRHFFFLQQSLQHQGELRMQKYCTMGGSGGDYVLRSLGANYWCSAILSIVKNCRATEKNIVESLKIEFNKKNWSRNRFEITSHHINQAVWEHILKPTIWNVSKGSQGADQEGIPFICRWGLLERILPYVLICYAPKTSTYGIREWNI